MSNNLKIGSVPSANKALSIKPKRQSATDITSETKKELSEIAQHINTQENKMYDRMKFVHDASFYFTVVFESTEARQKFLNQYNIKLEVDDYCFYEDIKHNFKGE